MGFQVSEDLDPSLAKQLIVDCNVEVPEKEWRPLAQGTTGESQRIAFVDGVRRIHTRFTRQTGSTVSFGAVGGLAAGCVAMRQSEINTFCRSLLSVSVKHILLVSDPTGEPSTISLPLSRSGGNSLELNVCRIEGRDPEEPVNMLQQLMREEESFVIEGIYNSGDAPDLVIADGPLNLHLLGPLPSVGYIKTIHTIYLPESLQPVVFNLIKGERTPIFFLQAKKRSRERVNRYSCYFRVETPGPRESKQAGIVRLEVSAAIELSRARELFDLCAGNLPRFVSPRGRDPRAPQNLAPLAALETELRHRIGNPALISRIVEDHF